MKLLMMVFDAALEDVIQVRLQQLGLEHWTKLERALGKGSRSQPLLNTHVWPGYHVVYFVKVDDFNPYRQAFQEMSQEFAHRGFRTFVLPLEEFI